MCNDKPSLGYLLADEGSGTDLGKILLNAYLKKELPAHLLQAFKDKYALKDEHILKEIYAHDQPNQYIASYTYFLSEHKEHLEIQELIKSSFDSFFKTYIVKYPDYTKLPVRFIGSIANEFGDLLKRSAQKFDIKIDLILKNPMEGLIDYHRSN